MQPATTDITDKKITQALLKELFIHDKQNGVLVRRTDRGPKKAGEIAGTIRGVYRTKYRLININNRWYRAHRLIWMYEYGEFPKGQLDHIDHNGLNNRLDNLREVSQLENNRNMPIYRTCKQGYPGLRQVTKKGSWSARINIQGKEKYLGTFATKEEAVRARKAAEIALWK